MTLFTSESAVALAGPPWLRRQRREAAERFAEMSFPSAALEEWRYSRIDDLDLAHFRPLTGPEQHQSELQPQAAALLEALKPTATLIETHDGFLAGVHSADKAVTVERLSAPDAPETAIGHIAGEPDVFAALNRAYAPAPLRIRVADDSEAKTVVVVHRLSAEGAAIFPRVIVEVGEQARASVLEIITGDAQALVAPVTELDIAGAGRLDYTHVQILGPNAWQIGLQSSHVGRDATLTSAAVTLGGDFARLRTELALRAPGASSRLLSLYFAAGSQMHDFHTVQNHQAPKTTSNLLYKGAVANTSRAVYRGLIRVEKGARGTNAMQTNRNLVLHAGAHADSVPNLEIEDNDVRCSHASAVGPIADDQRFYLESRGVPTTVADRLIALGFLDDVLQELPTPALRAPLRTELAEKLAAAERAETE